MASESYRHIAARSRFRDMLMSWNRLKIKEKIASGWEEDG